MSEAVLLMSTTINQFRRRYRLWRKQLTVVIGQTISHYEIFEKLGEGGIGVVYKVRNSPTRVFQRVDENFTPKAFGATLFTVSVLFRGVGTHEGRYL